MSEEPTPRPEPAEWDYYVGKHRVKLRPGVIRLPGEPCPEAARWKNLDRRIASGEIVRVLRGTSARPAPAPPPPRTVETTEEPFLGGDDQEVPGPSPHGPADSSGNPPADPANEEASASGAVREEDPPPAGHFDGPASAPRRKKASRKKGARKKG